MNLAEKPAAPGVEPGRISGLIGIRKVLKLTIWLLIPLVVWWSVRDISFTEISESFRQIGLQAVLVLLGINVFIFLLLSLRWWMVIRALGLRVSIISVIGYRLAGFGVTYFTPGPQIGGEPLQVYLLKERDGIPISPAATSVMIDKLLELLANFSFLLVGVSVLVFSGIFISVNKIILILFPVLLLTLPITYLVFLRAGSLPLSSFLRKLGRYFSNSAKFQQVEVTTTTTESMVSEFCRRNMGVLLAGAVLSVGIWILMVFEFNLMLRYLGIQFTLVQIMIALTAARIAFLLPFPAGLGTLEAGQVMAMGLIGFQPALGISLSLLIRARDVLFGGAGLWLSGLYNR